MVGALTLPVTVPRPPQIPRRVLRPRTVANVSQKPNRPGDSIRPAIDCPYRRLKRRQAIFAAGAGGKFHPRTKTPRTC